MAHWATPFSLQRAQQRQAVGVQVNEIIDTGSLESFDLIGRIASEHHGQTGIGLLELLDQRRDDFRIGRIGGTDHHGFGARGQRRIRRFLGVLKPDG